MAVEIVVFSSEMSRDMDPEKQQSLHHDLRRFTPRRQTDIIWRLIVHHKTSNVH